MNGAAATPDAFVATVMVAVLLLNMPDVPLPGAVNVTFTPATGLVPASRTVAASALGNAVPTVADCGVVPALAVMVVAVDDEVPEDVRRRLADVEGMSNISYVEL